MPADPTPPIMCDLSLLTDEQRHRVEELARRRFPQADEVHELTDGYALAYADASPELLADLAEFIALDRLCCAFLRHALVADAGPGRVRLELTGGPGAKEALRSDILGLVRL